MFLLIVGKNECPYGTSHRGGVAWLRLRARDFTSVFPPFLRRVQVGGLLFKKKPAHLNPSEVSG